MTHSPLPLELELAGLKSDDRASAVADYFAETVRTKGWQCVVALLRDIENVCLHSLRTGATGHERVLGRLTCVEHIRQALTALLPVGETPPPNWGDEEKEEFLSDDPIEVYNGLNALPHA